MHVAQNLILVITYLFQVIMIFFQFNDDYLKQHSFEKPC